MSQTASRRQRLLVARSLPQARCPRCGSRLDKVINPARHLTRCQELASLAAEASEVVIVGPPRRLPRWIRWLLGLRVPRGAAPC